MSPFRDVKPAYALVVLILIALPSAYARADGRPTAATDPGGGKIMGNVGVGFDTFQEKYSIVDEDTVDSITEFRSRLSLGYSRGTMLDDLFQVRGRTMIGDDSFEYAGSLNLIERFGRRQSRPGRFALSADVTRREYRNDSSYDFANDYTRYYLRSSVKWNLAENAALRLSDRVEVQDYQNRTEFDYDYTRNSVKLDAEVDWNFTNLAGAGVRFTTMTIPDSTEIQYESWTPEFELRIVPGVYKRFALYVTAERRLYAHEPMRSSFWALFSNASIEWPLPKSLSVEIHDDLEHYTYDTNTNVYFDYTESRNTLLVKYNHSWNARVGVGPTYSLFRSAASPDDEYDESGAKLAVDYMRGRTLWVSASYELGQRRYDAFEASSELGSIYSDYSYQRVNAIATVRVVDGINLSTVVDYQPEDHEREGDDSTATLFSISLTFAF